MLLKAELQEGSQRILIIAPQESRFLTNLKQRLEAQDTTVFVSRTEVANYRTYDVVFFVHVPHVLLPEIEELTDTKFIFIFFDNEQTAQTYSSFCYHRKLTHIKILTLETRPEFYDKDIDTILWFAFSRTADIYLHIFHPKKAVLPPKKKKPRKPFFTRTTLRQPKTIILLMVTVTILIHLLFIPPLLAASAFHYAATNAVRDGDIPAGRTHLTWADFFLKGTNMSYSLVQPTYHFFSIALPIEDMVQLNNSANSILHAGMALEENGKTLVDGLFTKDKSAQDLAAVLKAKDAIAAEVKTMQRHVDIIELKLPQWNDLLKQARTELKTVAAGLSLYEQIAPHLDTIFARDTEKKYLLLFANNMELRPGGGFIGSFGIVKVRNYTIEDIKVYDVYDADGQLKTPIAPPKPISKFLNQPYWFLRDSAFTGDFVDNFEEAELLLEEEIGETGFDGGLLMTTTGAKNILSAVETLYIPDFKDTVTADNFYMKAQLYAEQEFFPGSLQKKSFLSSVMDQMLLGMEQVSLPILLDQIQESLNQKQLVLYSTDAGVQELLEHNYWAGRILRPNCTVADALHCIPDYVFPLDANLGVNKANFYIERPVEMHVSISANGQVTNSLTLNYHNTSHAGVFPGGTYKNYFQLLVPPNSFVRSITIDGTPLEDYDETNFDYKTVGFLLQVPPQESRLVKITYTLPTTIIGGDGIYQLLVQKQIGSANTDFKLTVDTPDNIEITRHNLSPLAEDSEINYNTSISSDKIFLIEFTKH